MRGDRVEIVIDAGDGTRAYDVVATRAGRRVEVTQGRTVVEVTEVTRSGKPVRTARFMASRVLALVEHPAERPSRPVAAESSEPAPRRRYADEW
jgi:Mg-chelatase subunit ChlI